MGRGNGHPGAPRSARPAQPGPVSVPRSRVAAAAIAVPSNWRSPIRRRAGIWPPRPAAAAPRPGRGRRLPPAGCRARHRPRIAAGSASARQEPPGREQPSASSSDCLSVRHPSSARLPRRAARRGRADPTPHPIPRRRSLRTSQTVPGPDHGNEKLRSRFKHPQVAPSTCRSNRGSQFISQSCHRRSGGPARRRGMAVPGLTRSPRQRSPAAWAESGVETSSSDRPSAAKPSRHSVAAATSISAAAAR